MTHITTEIDEEPIIRLALNLGVENVNNIIYEGIGLGDNYIVFLNGNILGVIQDYVMLVRVFRLLRRKGKINGFVSIFVQHQHRSVQISSDSGRLCRPYIIVKNGEALVRSEHIQMLENNTKTFDDFLREGTIKNLNVVLKLKHF